MQSGAAHLLRDVLLEKTRKNPLYSHRAAARDLGISHTYLSLLLSGKKKLPFKRAVMFSQLMQLDELRTRQLLQAAAMESTRDKQCRAFLEASLGKSDSADSDEYAILELDRFKTLSEWYHIAILDLTLVESFRPDIDWIASTLGIAAHEAQSAVSRLERLGLLETTTRGWIKTKAKLVIPTNYTDHAIRSFHAQMIEKAKTALQGTSRDDFASREISGVTMAIDPRKLPEAKAMIQKFHRKLINFLAEGEAAELYQCNFQLFRLTPEPLSEKPDQVRKVKPKRLK